MHNLMQSLAAARDPASSTTPPGIIRTGPITTRTVEGPIARTNYVALSATEVPACGTGAEPHLASDGAMWSA